MNLNGLFDNLNKPTTNATIVPTNNMPCDSGSSFPIRDKSTLNQLLYKNEIHNKRQLPKNPDKKSLHEIIKSNTISKSDLDQMIDEDIGNLKHKSWTQMPLKLRRKLLMDYCVHNDLNLDESIMLNILKDRSLVKYSTKNGAIEALKI